MESSACVLDSPGASLSRPSRDCDVTLNTDRQIQVNKQTDQMESFLLAEISVLKPLPSNHSEAQY